MNKKYTVSGCGEAQIGDWVRFYQNGILTIAIVAYIREQKYYPYEYELCTDKGTVNITDILEMRK